MKFQQIKNIIIDTASIKKTKMEKVLKGAECHKTHKCKECPYHIDDTMLDPRIDPSYDEHVLDYAKKCRDELIKDITEIYIDR